MGRVLAVAVSMAALSVIGCGGSDDVSSTCDADLEQEKGHELILRLSPGTARPTAESRAETIEVLCRRLNAFGATAEISGAGPGRLRVAAAGRPPGLTFEQILIPPGALRIYDWEANLIGRPDGYPTASAAGGVAPRAVTTVALVEEPTGGSSSGSRWYVLRDSPAITNEDILEAEAETDDFGQPSLLLELTGRGREAFERLTRDVAQRGSGHYAIAFDDIVLTRPTVDPAESPDGIDARSGVQISGVFEDLREASAVATDLSVDPPPLRVELVSGGAGY